MHSAMLCRITQPENAVCINRSTSSAEGVMHSGYRPSPAHQAVGFYTAQIAVRAHACRVPRP
eukprot:12402158-Alexandrium_andersonii.AAC.1